MRASILGLGCQIYFLKLCRSTFCWSCVPIRESELFSYSYAGVLIKLGAEGCRLLYISGAPTPPMITLYLPGCDCDTSAAALAHLRQSSSIICIAEYSSHTFYLVLSPSTTILITYLQMIENPSESHPKTSLYLTIRGHHLEKRSQSLGKQTENANLRILCT